MSFQEVVRKVLADPLYAEYVEFGEPRSGHPEGKVKNHIVALEENLERYKPRLIDDEYWKLRFLIHTHDTLKAVAMPDVPSFSPGHHAVLARDFAASFTSNPDLLNIIYYHDENFYLWKQLKKTGQYEKARLERLLTAINDLDLFLIFILIDGCVPGKDFRKLDWFIDEVRKLRATRVDKSWILENPQ
ncbi:MAG: hypothetical protein AB1649_11420 [Chloroflexota bacterium]